MYWLDIKSSWNCRKAGETAFERTRLRSLGSKKAAAGICGHGCWGVRTPAQSPVFHWGSQECPRSESGWAWDMWPPLGWRGWWEVRSASSALFTGSRHLDFRLQHIHKCQGAGYATEGNWSRKEVLGIRKGCSVENSIAQWSNILCFYFLADDHAPGSIERWMPTGDSCIDFLLPPFPVYFKARFF